MVSALASAGNCFSMNVDPPSLWLSIAPGSSTTGTITVDNKGKEDIEVKAYTEDWVYNKDRSKSFRIAGSTSYSCSNWIVLSPSKFTVPAGGSASVKYTVTVPGNVSGGHYSVIFFESKAGTAKQNANILIAGRIGTIVYLDAAGSSKKSGQITDLGSYFDQQSNSLVFTMKFRNTGDTILSPEGSVIVTDIGAKLHAKAEIVKFYALQKELVQIKAKFPGRLRNGDYEMIATLDLGDGKPVSLSKSMKFPGDIR